MEDVATLGIPEGLQAEADRMQVGRGASVAPVRASVTP